MYHCAPTYTACGIETSRAKVSIKSSENCTPTYTACGIETKKYIINQFTINFIVHPLIPLEVLKANKKP